MALQRIVAALEAAELLVGRPATFPEITGVASDSRSVRPGMLFCAVRGTALDGHRFLPEAVARGAAAALVLEPSSAAVPQVLVRDSRRAAGVAAAEWYGRPGDRLALIGVTGTNGKSTTVALIRHLRNATGRAASLGTLGAFDPAGQALDAYPALTTAGPIELHRVLAEMLERGADSVVMEASSHALHQGRLEGLPFAAAVYTNLTREHLDYHGSVTEYRTAKAQLSTLVAQGGVEVLNTDDPAWEGLPERSGVRRVHYGRAEHADVRLLRQELDSEGSSVTLRLGTEEVTFRLPLVGEFNVSNAVAAAATVWALGMTARAVADVLQSAPQVPGRMERLVSRESPFLIVRDYAHTPDAFERVLTTLRPITSGRLVILFGAGGDRDRGKRPVMGNIAARLADWVILTTDNPRSEDPAAIIKDIEVGMDETPHRNVLDREEAIRDAVRELAPGDCLLLAGKGHETYQILGDTKQPFDEPSIVRAALAGQSGT